jgi:hypothetical protein
MKWAWRLLFMLWLTWIRFNVQQKTIPLVLKRPTWCPCTDRKKTTALTARAALT